MPFPIRQNARSARSKKTSLMPSSGTDTKTPQILIDTLSATRIENCFVKQQGVLEKINGTRKLGEQSETTLGKVYKKWTNTLDIVAFGTTVQVFNKNTNTYHDVKTDFSANITDGRRLGLDFYTCNSRFGDKIYKTTLPTLLYDTQTVNFTVGLTITGGTSGATATIISDTDGGATGTLELDNITGIFQTGETITDSSTGSAKANGVLVFTNTAEIAASPKCNALGTYNKRLLGISTDTSEFEVKASKENDTSDWTASATAGEAFSFIWTLAGEAKGATNFQARRKGDESFSAAFFVAYKDGYAAFDYNILDVGGSQQQDIPTIFEHLNDGGERGAISVESGVVIGNENGLFYITPNGERINILESMKSSRIYNLDMTDMDACYWEKENLIFITLRENGEGRNNLIIWVDARTLGSKNGVSWGEITGVQIARLFADGDKVYALSSSKIKTLELFARNYSSYEDNVIYTIYEQPFNIGALEKVKDWIETYIGGYLHANSNLTITIRGTNTSGTEVDLFNFTFSGDAVSGESSNYGKAKYGKSGYAFTPSSSEQIWKEIFDDNKAYGYKFYKIKITSSDIYPHAITYLSALLEEGDYHRNLN
jgi:hypothetical protein